MQTKKITIINKLGLHARAAAKLVALTGKFSANVEIISPQKKVNGKSILGVMMLAAGEGTTIEVITNGDDEIELLEAIEQLIMNKFGENE